MSNNELNKEQLEQLMSEAMRNVAKREDEALIDAMSNLSPDDLDKMLGKDATAQAQAATAATASTSDNKKPKLGVNWMSFVRLAAACAAVILIIVGIDKLNLGNNNTTSYASLFETYYTEYVGNDATFDAKGKTVNDNGKPNTAAILQDASKLINEKQSRIALRKGTQMLETLLKSGQSKPELEHEIHWYLALAYLKDNRIDKARSELQEVVYLKSPHSADAQKVLAQIKK